MQAVVPCKVCGTHRSSGIHFGAITCEACKAFFHRAVSAKLVGENGEIAPDAYRCFATASGSTSTPNQMCNIMNSSRRKCQYCRLKRCIIAGMNPNGSEMGRPSKIKLASLAAEINGAADNDSATPTLARLPVGNPRIRPGKRKSDESMDDSRPPSSRMDAQSPSTQSVISNDSAGAFRIVQQPVCVSSVSAERCLTSVISATSHLLGLRNVRVALDSEVIGNSDQLDIASLWRSTTEFHSMWDAVSKVIEMTHGSASNYVNALPGMSSVPLNDRQRLVRNYRGALATAMTASCHSPGDSDFTTFFGMSPAFLQNWLNNIPEMVDSPNVSDSLSRHISQLSHAEFALSMALFVYSDVFGSTHDRAVLAATHLHLDETLRIYAEQLRTINGEDNPQRYIEAVHSTVRILQAMSFASQRFVATISKRFPELFGSASGILPNVSIATAIVALQLSENQSLLSTSTEDVSLAKRSYAENQTIDVNSLPCRYNMS